MLITLTTDFGADSPYVAAMKGVILTLAPEARLIDLSHAIPPQDLRFAHFFLASTVPYFPPAAIHVVVVDPGVGTTRRLLYVEASDRRLLTPDNGCWTGLAKPGEVKAWSLTESRYWRQPVSSTFHGRDILAPVAAHLALGLDPALLGPVVTDWQSIALPEATIDLAGQTARGEVICVDRFGNLITNIPAEMVTAIAAAQVRIGPRTITRFVRAYGDAAEGTLVALFSSFGTLEIAVAQGNAAQTLGVGRETAVLVSAGLVA